MDALDAVGGMIYISQLTNNISSSSNTEFHARIIAEKFIKRSLISISNNIIGDAFNDTIDIFDLLNTAEEKLFNVTEGTLRKSYDKMSILIKGALDNIEVLRQKEDGLSALPSGFTKIDRVTSGWQNSDTRNLIAIGEKIFFVGDDGLSGDELRYHWYNPGPIIS